MELARTNYKREFTTSSSLASSDANREASRVFFLRGGFDEQAPRWSRHLHNGGIPRGTAALPPEVLPVNHSSIPSASLKCFGPSSLASLSRLNSRPRALLQVHCCRW